MANNENRTEQVQDLNELLQIRRDKLTELQENGQNPFEITKYDVTAHSKEIIDHFDCFEGKTVSIAGRMMSKRVMGKASFAHFRDNDGLIQSYIRKDEVGEDVYLGFKKMDIGDIVGIEGTVFRTQHGEVSIRAQKLVLLSKSLLPLPEKFHGLKDMDTRYRQRYVDLIVNPEVKDTFVKRSKIITEIRITRQPVSIPIPALRNLLPRFFFASAMFPFLSLSLFSFLAVLPGGCCYACYYTASFLFSQSILHHLTNQNWSTGANIDILGKKKTGRRLLLCRFPMVF